MVRLEAYTSERNRATFNVPDQLHTTTTLSMQHSNPYFDKFVELILSVFTSGVQSFFSVLCCLCCYHLRSDAV